MRISRPLRGTLAALTALVSAACSRPPAPGPEPSAARSASREELRETYRPPADGRLAPQQVERYLAVWKHVPNQDLGPSARATPFAGRTALLGDVTDSVTTDAKVAREQGWNAGEYLWVRERILEAEAARMTAKLNEESLAMLERTVAELRGRVASAPDEGSRTLLEEQIAAFSDEAERVKKESSVRESESVRANVRTLEPFRGKLDALRDQIDRVYKVASGENAPKRAPEPRPAR